MMISSPWDSLIQPPRSCYISHILYLFTSQRRCKLSKIAVLGCKNHLNTSSKFFHRLELSGAARSHASEVKGQTRRVEGSGSTSHRIAKS